MCRRRFIISSLGGFAIARLFANSYIDHGAIYCQNRCQGKMRELDAANTIASNHGSAAQVSIPGNLGFVTAASNAMASQSLQPSMPLQPDALRRASSTPPMASQMNRGIEQSPGTRLYSGPCLPGLFSRKAQLEERR